MSDDRRLAELTRSPSHIGPEINDVEIATDISVPWAIAGRFTGN